MSNMFGALFIPLKTEYYEAFDSGKKTRELRLYGKRWNEKTCRVGRPVIISKGYGKQNRRHGKISSFEVVTSAGLTPEEYTAMRACYGADLEFVAIIGIQLNKDIGDEGYEREVTV